MTFQFEESLSVIGIDADRLREWMDARGIGRGDLTDWAPLGGGTQNVVVRFSRDGHSFVLRRPPLNKRRESDEAMRREARLLAALAGTDVPHARLIAAEPDENVLGAAFYLMDPVDGFVPTGGMPPLHAGDPGVRRQMGISFCDAAVRLGAVDYVAAGLESFGRPEGYLERQVPRWRAQLDSYAGLRGEWTLDIPHVDVVGVWLEANRPISFTPGIIHGDFHLGNAMFRIDQGAVAAIVDWELATVGDPLLDLGMIMAFWPDDGSERGVLPIRPWHGFPTLSEMVDHYAAHTTRDVSAIHWYGVLACYKTGIILEGTHARAQAGKASTKAGDLLHATTLRLFERAMALAKSG